jgi:DNA repair exonuclease SbcCD ATPase subunit
MPDLQKLGARLSSKKQEIDSIAVEARMTLERAKEVKEQIEALQREIVNLDKAGVVLNSIGEERQLKAQDTIEALVTRGLQQIFDDSLSFHILQTVKAKAANVDFVVRTTLADGSIVDTPVMDARGGGLAATIGFLLRVVILLLKNGRDKDNILILDETFAHVSDEYLEGVGEFLRELVDKTGIQIVMVTHQPVFGEYADAVYRFTAVNGRTKVETL